MSGPAGVPALLHEFLRGPLGSTPDAIAIDVPPGRGRSDRVTVSYAGLDARARAFAAELSRHVRGECVVAILLGREGPELYAAQIGVLRAGAAFVCLDRAVPDDHLRFVLRDAQAVSCITDAEGAQRLRRAVPELTRLIDVADIGDRADPAPAPVWLRPDSLAYLIYTSGTTGRPKGVMIEHRGIANLIGGDRREFALGVGDRVAQGSSPAYDSSVEETWLALASGATVVPLDDETVRLGPDLVSWLRREHISVLCPPPTLLRTTGCRAPREELPDLRLVYAGGEALPQDLADLWADGRRFVNGYGPTECSVTVVRCDVHVGEAVAIGTAVPGNTAFVLDEALNDVVDGESGELCIAGIGLARGYLGAPELTAAKFVAHPRHGRIYRTGDRVHRAADGRLFYEGRLDAQVKLRGHRVELAEIEARLAEIDGVREAACRVQDGDTLVAFLVPRAARDDGELPRIAARLRERVPSHMVPARMAWIDVLPTTLGGKLDRKALPKLADRDGARGREAADELEASIAAVFARALHRASMPIDADFFEHGGDSVRAAMVISVLRDDLRTAVLSVRDLYETRDVERLAARAREHAPRATSARPDERRRTAVLPATVTVLQTLWLLFELVLGSTLTYAAAFVGVPALLAWVEPWLLVVLVPVLMFAARLALGVLSVLATLCTKWLMIGRYTARREPVWSLWYLRHWIVTRCARWIPWGTFLGTELHSVALRALGAKVGKGVFIHRGVDLFDGGWDLLEIGDEVSLGQDATVGLVELDAGCVVIGPVRLSRGATLEVRAGVAAGTEIGEDGCLSALSALRSGDRIPAGERWDGVPARPAGSSVARPTPTMGSRRLGVVVHTTAVLIARTVLASAASLPFVLMTVAALLVLGIDSRTALRWVDEPTLSLRGLAITASLFTLSIPLGLIVQGLALRFWPNIRSGVCPRRSLTGIAVMLRTRAVESAGLWLSGTLFWPTWLRLAGARIGRRCEISTVLGVLPEQLRIGEDSFFADGIYLGGPKVDRGTVSVGPVEIGAGTFLGNHVVIDPGTTLQPGVLLGVCTKADDGMRAGSSWFGHPAFELPRREVVEVDRRFIFEPSPIRRVNRLCWEAARFLIPTAPLVAAAFWCGHLASTTATGAALWFVEVPLVTLCAAFGLTLLVLIAKWALLGRVRPGQHVLWSCWCSRWDFLYVVWAMLARALLVRISGTLLLNFYLRATGVKIGRRVLLGSGFAQVVDPDMLEFDDGSTVDSMFQAHSFEDRVLKIDRVRVGRGATLQRSTVVLYGTVIEDGARVTAHSVVMKNERLPARRDHEGVPTRPL
ncbi:MAG: amino acid adenylation domain-containing protein [Planctomycetota bacterium]